MPATNSPTNLCAAGPHPILPCAFASSVSGMTCQPWQCTHKVYSEAATIVQASAWVLRGQGLRAHQELIPEGALCEIIQFHSLQQLLGRVESLPLCLLATELSQQIVKHCGLHSNQDWCCADTIMVRTDVTCMKNGWHKEESRTGLYRAECPALLTAVPAARYSRAMQAAPGCHTGACSAAASPPAPPACKSSSGHTCKILCCSIDSNGLLASFLHSQVLQEWFCGTSRECSPGVQAPPDHAIEGDYAPGALIEHKCLAIPDGDLIAVTPQLHPLQPHLVCQIPENCSSTC